MSEATALERAVVGELLTILTWIEALPDDQIDPDTAVKMEEDIAGVVHSLGAQDRATFVSIAIAFAEEADASKPGSGSGFRAALDALGLGEP